MGEEIREIDCDKALDFAKHFIRNDVFPATKYYGAFYGENLIGIIGVYERGFYKLKEVKHFYVIDSYRRQGFGTKLLKKIIDLFPEPLLSTVRTSNIGVLNIFGTYGFGIIKRMVSDISGKEIFVLLRNGGEFS